MKFDELLALLRRRGVLWPSAEIYGGAQGLYDYGPVGAALKRRVEDAWSAWFVGLSDDFYSIDPAEMLPEAVVRASGHLENFTDPDVRCPHCEKHFRADTVLEKWRPEGVDGLAPTEVAELLQRYAVRCPNCGRVGLTVPRPFNLMFGLEFGASGGERVYLRPETAQGSYLAFPRMWDVGRRSLPLGIAVIGKAYRNEIAPRQVLFRMRAFTQAELQIFFDPDSVQLPLDRVSEEKLPVLRVDRRTAGAEAPELRTAAQLISEGLPEFFVFYLVHMYRFFRHVLRCPTDRLRLLEKSDTERAFYNRIQFDVEVNLASLGGYKEIAAVHYRGDYDLSRHSQGSGKELSVSLGDRKKLLPHVMELTFGVDRALWALADWGIEVEGDRTVWRVPPYLASVSVGVFPLIRKEHDVVARDWCRRLRREGIAAAYDTAGSIGRRYARQDEVGTPFGLTIDRETVEATSSDGATATLRERDSKSQVRVTWAQLLDRLRPQLVAPRPEPLDASP